MAAFSTDADCWVLEPRELADLKVIFDEACRRAMIAKDTEAAQILATRLLEAVKSGVRDRETLLRLVRARTAA